MRFTCLVAVVAVAGLTILATGTSYAAETADAASAGVVRVQPPVPAASYAPPVRRPVILPALYAALGAMQAWDVHTTGQAIKAGAVEANPTAAPFARSGASLIGLKAATTAGTIFFAERLWKKNKVAAIVTLVAINGATAAVSMHNLRTAAAAASTR